MGISLIQSVLSSLANSVAVIESGGSFDNRHREQAKMFPILAVGSLAFVFSRWRAQCSCSAQLLHPAYLPATPLSSICPPDCSGHQQGDWTNNQMHDNIEYGFDPHDDSDYLNVSFLFNSSDQATLTSTKNGRSRLSFPKCPCGRSVAVVGAQKY